MKISVIVLTLNAEKHIYKSLSALAKFDEIIVVDKGSTDDTIKIAKEFKNVMIEQNSLMELRELKNFAVGLAKNDWVICINGNQIFSEELITEIGDLDLSKTNRVYQVSRLNHYRGNFIKTCGWYPDFVKLLYNKKIYSFNSRITNEEIEVVKLKNSFLSYSVDNATELIDKMQQDSTLFAQEYRFKKKSSTFKAIIYGISSFFKSYIIKKGIISGRDGFVISFANSCTSYYKYIKLVEASHQLTTSLIITTYNRPDALEIVLTSIFYQKELPDEIIIADDGSTQQTKVVIDKFKECSIIPIKHVWQPDDGFRAAQSRNRALAIAKNEYIIFIDGDMVLHPEFIADHKKAAKKGVYIQGGRVVLTKEKTDELLQNPTKYRVLKWYEKKLENRFEKRFSTLHIPFLSNFILKKEKNYGIYDVRSCNISFFREEALAINGFNNDFVGWGREDSEFIA